MLANVKSNLVLCKRNGFNPENLNGYCLFWSFENCVKKWKNPSEFLATVNKFRPRGCSLNQIAIQEWEKFYKSILPSKLIEFFRPLWSFAGRRYKPKEELLQSVTNRKVNKAVGLRCIPNKCLKSLNSPLIQFLLDLYNEVFNNELIPSSWSSIKLRLIHKKGDPRDPFNYRDIAIFNTVTKIFTVGVIRG